ncbi:uncharacterized protein LOC115888276 isoform X2 [Sitophilus oryzae]|uniref:Uncharacterized protein LOC115888276 isoform X2 n=1 Tax=Sitophilus oryzae TaxID=7048 RepID=A0A6J2YKY8_SITOR|nr:uncharacterized protein LOC115888276 isoform X2 [Sitophilus oryzae]
MDKSRGRDHIKNKAKYKGNTKKNPKYVPSKSKPNLESNWDRYDEEEETKQNKTDLNLESNWARYEEKQPIHDPHLTSSTDFSLLASLPISAGSHFQYKFDENDKKLEGIFCLDVDLLHKSILTVPLYERIGISKQYFEDEEVKSMDADADQSLVCYKEYIDSISTSEEQTNCSNKEKVPEVDKNEMFNKKLPMIFRKTMKIWNSG